MPVIIHEHRTSDVVAVQLWVRAGYLLGNLAMDCRTSARHAWYMALFEVTAGGWDFPEEFARAVEAVTSGDVARVARQYLTRPTVVVVQPPRVEGR